MNVFKVVLYISFAVILAGCVQAEKSVFSGEFDTYDRVVTVYHKENVVTKEVYETTAPIEYWGFNSVKDARSKLNDEKQKLIDAYSDLPRGTVEFDFKVHKNDTITQKMTIYYDEKKKLDALIKADLINEEVEVSDGAVSYQKHKFRFQRNGLNQE